MAQLEAEKIKACTSVTSATVIDYDGSNHSSGIIQYDANGVTYRGAKLAGMRLSDVGTKLTIHYDPQNPARFYAGEKKDFSWNGWLIGMGTFLVGVPLITMVAYFDTIRKTKHSSISN
jgi:hypothetical protein